MPNAVQCLRASLLRCQLVRQPLSLADGLLLGRIDLLGEGSSLLVIGKLRRAQAFEKSGLLTDGCQLLVEPGLLVSGDGQLRIQLSDVGLSVLDLKNGQRCLHLDLPHERVPSGPLGVPVLPLTFGANHQIVGGRQKVERLAVRLGKRGVRAKLLERHQLLGPLARSAASDDRTEKEKA